MWEKDTDADYLVANQPLLALEGILYIYEFKKQTTPNSLKKEKEGVKNESVPPDANYEIFRYQA